MGRYKETIIIAIIALLVGIVFGCIISNWVSINPNFYNVRLIEIIQLIVTGIIAIFITHVVKSRISQDIKKREMFYELITKFQENLNIVIGLGYEYVDSPNALTEKKIKRKFKELSILLGIMRDFKKSNTKLFKYLASAKFS